MEENKILKLAPKRPKGLAGLIFSRTGVVLLLFLLAMGLLFSVFKWFSGFIAHIVGGVWVFNAIIIVLLCNTDMDSSAKTTWTIVILFTSVFGALFYLYQRIDIGNVVVRKEYQRLITQHKDTLPQDPAVQERIQRECPSVGRLVTYLNHNDAFPATIENKVTYYPLGEAKWSAMLAELRKAEKFIFMEYFIVEEGLMWGSILEILKDKAAQGVEVRVMYDGTCAITKLPYDYPELVEKLGIQCKMFSPLRPFLSTHYNYRDHRKILVIDGKVGFCGGVNLADEYINKKEVFGHWKDVAVMVQGEAVKSLTHMFLNNWCFGEENPDYATYLEAPAPHFPAEPGYVIPYGFNPFEKERVGERVYLDILNRANHYVHIMTPYLILDDELLQSLKYAAKRGVDVKLILPGVPDKKMVYALAKTYFPSLMESGVQLYFYTPGFVHAKVFVSDDAKAVVGTINLDYRSLYHHFECGVFLYETPCIRAIEEDFTATLQKCERVTGATLLSERLPERLIGSTARLVAPLL